MKRVLVVSCLFVATCLLAWNAAALGSGGDAGWTRLNPQHSGKEALGVALADASHGWAVGIDWNTGTGFISATKDGGKTWTIQVPPRQYGPPVFASVACAGTAHAWAVGSGGSIRATSDGGVHWASQISGTTNSLNDVWFVSTCAGGRWAPTAPS